MIRSHYIPQFILREFCENEKIQYMDIESKSIESRNTRSVFSVDGYYPEQLEQNLNDKIEKVFAPLHKKIISSSDKLTLSAAEMFLLKKFLLVSVLRYNAKDAFGEQLLAGMSVAERESLFGNFFENIGKILECKKREELASLRYYGITDTNMTLSAYAKDVTGSYLIFVGSKACGREFLMPDKGNAWYMGNFAVEKYAFLQEIIAQTQSTYAQLALQFITPHDYMIFPLSRDVAAVCMSGFYKLLADNSKYNIFLGSIRNVLGFGDRKMLRAGKVAKDKNEIPVSYKHSINQLCGRDVEFLNNLLLKNAESHIAFANKGKLGIDL